MVSFWILQTKMSKMAETYKIFLKFYIKFLLQVNEEMIGIITPRSKFWGRIIGDRPMHES